MNDGFSRHERAEEVIKESLLFTTTSGHTKATAPDTKTEAHPAKSGDGKMEKESLQSSSFGG